MPTSKKNWNIESTHPELFDQASISPHKVDASCNSSLLSPHSVVQGFVGVLHYS